MKVKCINSSNTTYLTHGREYTVLDELDGQYKVYNGWSIVWYPKYRFESISKPLTELQVGDTVKVLRAGSSSKDFWCTEMNQYVGKIYKIVKIGNLSGPHLIELSNGSNTYSWFSKDTLEIVKRKEDEMNYTANDTVGRNMVKNRQWIVGSINASGEFSMSLNPAAHTSESAAKTEAKRLAAKDSTKTFIVMQLRAGYKVANVEEI